ncbi:conserved Plasmodium protein, unknown function [Plasmodium yoelii]|uniref:Uncharacterized protein n=2 Tax=Plasmodium yoelii TaxID=5861 RepID=A0AAE9X3Y9_PLAYO|nr:conserved Plasmodium protein, unknown function [Plasmodium yoelii]WBY61172.1 hypothetical protein Py17XNL_001401371 [Plasmodium yoelii yoelii]CDU20888.1 conserved Plasmodium protein, unknown function [Plasmodium yoelii]VTZ81854.1 conserved Plasmodium protein, unknown function [Plasmodium yoelii]|eukprot:XP_022813023.1 conserved Plasmodium protein, unknown function [Plasmodium yoelii]
MDNVLSMNYLKLTEELKKNNLDKIKLSLKCNNLCVENIDYNIIENFGKSLKNNKSFKGIIDISYNNLNEINLFNLICNISQNKQIIGLNIKGNVITKMILKKILLIIETNYIEYLNIQHTKLNNQEIRNIIFSSLNNNVKILKLHFLTLNNFLFLIKYIKENSSLQKIHFYITYKTEIINNLNIKNENDIQLYPLYIHNLRKAFKEFLEAIENKDKIINVKCKTDIYDSEIKETINYITHVCNKHVCIQKRNKENCQKGMEINSLEKVKLLLSDINGKERHIKKFEKELPIVFDKDVLEFIQKTLT